jgi:DNA-directed RNA polymerase alpha subunit
MNPKEEAAIQKNIAAGQRLNLVIGDVADTTPLKSYRAELSNRRFYGQVLAAEFSSDELGTINRCVNAAVRAGIEVVGALRIKTTEELVQIDGIGIRGAHFLGEAFKHPLSSTR